MKTYFKGESLFRSEVVGDNQETITILNGDKGWARVGGSTFHLSKNEIIPLKNGLAIQFRPDLLLLSFPKHRFTWRTQENDRTLDQIDVSGFLSGEYVRGRLSIDVATNLLYKYEFELEREFPSGKGIIRGEEKFLQYREFEGIKMPSEIISKQGKKVSRLIVEKAEFNSMLQDSLFQDPTPVNAIK
jgi:antitoxin component YwqK of YwqJK toxin-antitoxin module